MMSAVGKCGWKRWLHELAEGRVRTRERRRRGCPPPGGARRFAPALRRPRPGCRASRATGRGKRLRRSRFARRALDAPRATCSVFFLRDEVALERAQRASTLARWPREAWTSGAG